MARKKSNIKVLSHNKICKLYDEKVNKELLDMCVKVSEKYGRGVGGVMIKRLDAWTEEFSELYNKYLDALHDRNVKLGDKYIKDMRQTQDMLVGDIVASKGGYMVADIIEKKGVSVDWQKTPVNYIDDEDTINFLVSKGYDFNKEFVSNNIKLGFTDYHLALMADNEQKTVQYYNKLIDVVKRRDNLIDEFQKNRDEYEDPETTQKRKDELWKKMIADNDIYLKIEEVIPSLYKQVDGTMANYFIHAGCLEQAIEKGLLSQENLQKIGIDTFKESINNMLGRSQKMKQIKEFFIDKQTNAGKEDKNALATASLYGHNVRGVSGLLAGLENPPAVYETYAKQAAPILAVISSNEVSSTQNENVSGKPTTQLARLGTVVEPHNNEVDESANHALKEAVRI